MPTALNDAKKSAFISGLIYCAIKSSYCSTVIRSGGHLPHSAGVAVASSILCISTTLNKGKSI